MNNLKKHSFLENHVRFCQISGAFELGSFLCRERCSTGLVGRITSSLVGMLKKNGGLFLMGIKKSQAYDCAMVALEAELLAE